ncbi:CgeB family protein [Granulicoccus phenolivorans]|uniref:CgeB family protein n=1 Tax=Granulicoccus phenolivorans TaxID=266854 RepID=UPI0004198D5D|nr:glycosyltransferase [Granulicoccus phenolivorans]
MTARRILLISPAFHGYHRAIADALRARGHRVTTLQYDRLANPVRRVHNKLRREGLRIGQDPSTKAALDALQSNPDLVLVVRGDHIGQAFWETLDERGIPRALWIYDELRRMEWTPQRLELVGPIASYSPLDVTTLTEQGFEAMHLPDAFDTRCEFTPKPSPEITFVGAKYPRREQALLALDAAGIPVRAYGRDWSHAPLDRLRTRNRPRPDIPASPEISRAEAYAVMAGSQGTINIHGDQDGFTMRTFEAPGVGGVHLVDRPDIELHYEPGIECLVFTSDEELVDLSRRLISDPKWADGIREQGRRRTLAEHTFDHRMAQWEQQWG